MAEMNGWEKFDKPENAGGWPPEKFVRVLKVHGIRLSSALFKESELCEGDYVEIYYDESDGRIEKMGLEPTNRTPTAYKLSKISGNVFNIGCVKFLNEKEVEDGKYDAEWNDEEGMIVIDLRRLGMKNESL